MSVEGQGRTPIVSGYTEGGLNHPRLLRCTLHFRDGSCVTRIAGPNGDAQLLREMKVGPSRIKSQPRDRLPTSLLQLFYRRRRGSRSASAARQVRTQHSARLAYVSITVASAWRGRSERRSILLVASGFIVVMQEAAVGDRLLCKCWEACILMINRAARRISRQVNPNMALLAR
jgi:hypothetical protein